MTDLWIFDGVAGSLVEISMTARDFVTDDEWQAVPSTLVLSDPSGTETAEATGYFPTLVQETVAMILGIELGGPDASITASLCSTGTYTIRTGLDSGYEDVGVDYTLSLVGGVVAEGACEPPSAPRNLVADFTRYGTSELYSVNYEWEVPEIGTETWKCETHCPLYTVQRSVNGSTWEILVDSTRQTFGGGSSGFDWGTTYFIRVAAINDFGIGPWAETSLVFVDTPAPPDWVAACRVGDSDDYRISWGEAEFDGGSPVTSFIVERDYSYVIDLERGAVLYPQEVISAESSPVTITEPANLSTAGVRAVNAYGESGLAAAVRLRSSATASSSATEPC
jgi:hypothetical protein